MNISGFIGKVKMTLERRNGKSDKKLGAFASLGASILSIEGKFLKRNNTKKKEI